MDKESSNIWNEACKQLKGILSGDIYERWIAVIQCLEISGNNMRLAVANDFYKDWLEENYFPMIRKAVMVVSGKEMDITLEVDSSCFDTAKDKVLMGSERRSMVLSEKERRNTAYHESGHALVARLLPGTDPVHKVTIVPRGMALGLTQQLPEEDRHSYSRDFILSSLAILYGGRIAEELVLDEITTGASNDIEKATELARKMVCEWGMSEGLGPIMLGKPNGEPFLGMDITQRTEYSEATASSIDKEVGRILADAYAKAKDLLKSNLAILHKMAEALLEREVLDSKDIDEIMGITGTAQPTGA
jgi:cell division protease FtsH